MLNQVIGLGQARMLAQKNETVDYDCTVGGSDVWVARRLDSSGQTRAHAARLHPDDVEHLLAHGWTRETIRAAVRRGCELPS